nr:hypothetical protein [Polymorphobacter sp.]
MHIARSSVTPAVTAILLCLAPASPAAATVAVAHLPPAASPAAAQPAPLSTDPAAKPFVTRADSQAKAVAPLSAGLAAIGNDLADDAASWKVRRVRFRDAVLTSLEQPAVVQIVVVGVGLIVVAVFLRRRRRRRLGWGVLPARSSMLPHRPDPAP